MMINYTYAGIGSRETPVEILEEMTYLGEYFARHGFTLRSGGAPGADSAFEMGSDLGRGKKEIFLPWRGFNDNPSNLYQVSEQALEMASHLHPAWHKLKDGGKKLQARNCYQILGQNLDNPVDFVVCYTREGKGQGGTGQALRLAIANDLPIIDFGLPNAKEKINQVIVNLYHKTS